MSEKRRGLGKGLGALIPTAPVEGRPVDVFFPDQRGSERAGRTAAGAVTTSPDSAPSDASTAASSQSRATAAARAASARNGQGKGRKRASIPRDAVPPRRTASGASATPSAHSPATEPQDRDGVPEPEVAVEQRVADVPVAEPAVPVVPVAEPPVVDAGTPEAPVDAAAAPADAASLESDIAEGTTAPEAPVIEAPAAVTAGTPAAAEAPEDESALVPVPGATFAEIPVGDVVANRRQPRQVFDEEELEELAASIREVGVLQPIVVRPLPAGQEASYELIMGERRWRASQLAGSTTVPAIVRQVEDDDLLRDALLENLHRAQLNPLEEAAAYQQLLEDFSCTHEELAARIVRSRPQISNTLRLLKLPPLVQRRVAAGILSAGHARALLGLSDPAAMERLAQRIVAEGLSVRTTEEIVALGDEPIAPEMRRRPRAGEHTAELNELATRLADRFDTRVKIGMGQRKGKINIEFASLEDLNRILDVLAPTVERPPLN